MYKRVDSCRRGTEKTFCSNYLSLSAREQNPHAPSEEVGLTQLELAHRLGVQHKAGRGWNDSASARLHAARCL